MFDNRIYPWHTWSALFLSHYLIFIRVVSCVKKSHIWLLNLAPNLICVASIRWPNDKTRLFIGDTISEGTIQIVNISLAYKLSLFLNTVAHIFFIKTFFVPICKFRWHKTAATAAVAVAEANSSSAISNSIPSDRLTGGIFWIYQEILVFAFIEWSACKITCRQNDIFITKHHQIEYQLVNYMAGQKWWPFSTDLTNKSAF